MSMSWVGVKLVGACEPGNFTQVTAPIAYAQNSRVEVSPVFGPRDERAKSTWPVVSAFRQLIPADEPLGGVTPPPHGPPVVLSDVHVNAPVTASAGTYVP